MKKLLLNFLKKTATKEIKDALERNLTVEERTTLINYLLKVRDKAKNGCGKEILNIIIQSTTTN